MIDKKKIEEAAEKHMMEQFYSDGDWEFPCDIHDIQSQCMNDFMTGINWFLGNLWHDASEVPKVNDTEISVLVMSKENTFGVVRVSKKVSNESWKDCVGYFNGFRWLYIDDLLKGGK